MQFLEGEVCLYDASGLYSSSQHIILRWDVVCLGYPLQVIQVAVRAEHKTE